MGRMEGHSQVIHSLATDEQSREPSERKPYQRPSDRAFAIFRRRVIEQVAAVEIAKEYGISRERVHFLIRRVINWSKDEERVGDVLALKIQHTAMLYDLYRDARIQWQRSCQNATVERIVSVTGKVDKKGGPLPEQKTITAETRGQSGNPALMKCMDDLLGSIRGIWGADAPKQTEVDEHREIVIRVVQDDEWYSNPHLALAAPAGAPASDPGIGGAV